MKNNVWLASYTKSGNTWFRMFLVNYEKNSEEPVSLCGIESTQKTRATSSATYVLEKSCDKLEKSSVNACSFC
jgi:hypothetical protein